MEEVLKALFYHHAHDADKAIEKGSEELYKAATDDMGELINLAEELDPKLAEEFSKASKKYGIKEVSSETYSQPNTKNLYNILDKNKDIVHVKIHPKGFYDKGEPTTMYSPEEWARLKKTLKLKKVSSVLKEQVQYLITQGYITLAEELDKAIKPTTVDVHIVEDLPAEKVERIKNEFYQDALNTKTFEEFSHLLSKAVIELQLTENDREPIANVLNKIRELAGLEKF